MEVIATTAIYQGVGPNRKITLPNDKVKLKDSEAKALISKGFAKKLSESNSDEELENSAPTQESTHDAKVIDPKIGDIINAIELLEEKDFAQDCKPKVRPLEEILGFNISQAERDEAWGVFQTQNTGE